MGYGTALLVPMWTNIFNRCLCALALVVKLFFPYVIFCIIIFSSMMKMGAFLLLETDNSVWSQDVSIMVFLDYYDTFISTELEIVH